MFVHAFLAQWKPEATRAQIEQAAQTIRALQSKIPGLLSVAVGANLSPRGGCYTFGGIMQFTDREAYEAYYTHPAHQALLEQAGPLLLAPTVELDLPAEG